MHLQKAERGGDVGLKEVFDKIHQRKGTGGPVYVNKKAKDFGVSDSNSCSTCSARQIKVP